MGETYRLVFDAAAAPFPWSGLLFFGSAIAIVGGAWWLLARRDDLARGAFARLWRRE